MSRITHITAAGGAYVAWLSCGHRQRIVHRGIYRNPLLRFQEGRERMIGRAMRCDVCEPKQREAA